jgi:hypothetical protein
LTGCLIHGPYITLEPGTYRFLIRGTLPDKGEAGATVDIAVEKGARILARTAIHKPETDDMLASLELCLHETTTDLEIRVWADTGSAVTVSSVEIQPVLQSEPIAAVSDNMCADTLSSTEVNADQTTGPQLTALATTDSGDSGSRATTGP